VESDAFIRLVVASADPAALLPKATWYLAINLPCRGGPRGEGSPHPAAGLEEIVRIYGIRHWIDQSYKQIKGELGWADFQTRSDTAIRRHQALVDCAFSLCCDQIASQQIEQALSPSQWPHAGPQESTRTPGIPSVICPCHSWTQRDTAGPDTTGYHR
jgi:hypothetical protein